MLTIALCDWNFLKTIHNKAETVLKDFVIAITCFKFDQEPSKSKVPADVKSCTKSQKLPSGLWLRLPTIEWIIVITSMTIFCQCCATELICLVSLFLRIYTHTTYNQEVLIFALKTKSQMDADTEEKHLFNLFFLVLCKLPLVFTWRH